MNISMLFLTGVFCNLLFFICVNELQVGLFEQNVIIPNPDQKCVHCRAAAAIADSGSSRVIATVCHLTAACLGEWREMGTRACENSGRQGNRRWE